MIAFGEILRKLRTDKGYSQAQLAKKIGVSSSMVALYETGDRFPSLETLLRVAQFMKVSTDYLLGNTMSKDSYVDVRDLSAEQIQSIEFIIENYRQLNK